MKNINWRIIGLFIFIIFTWGFAWPVNKIGLAYLSPAWYTALRLIIGTVTMMTIVFCMGKLSIPDKRDLPLIAIIGLLQISVYILLANIGLKYLPPGRSSMLAYTTPLWVMPAATIFFHEKSGWVRWLGFGFGVTGLMILLSPWQINWLDHHNLFGAGMLLLASLCWAISMLCTRYMKWHKSPLELIPWQLLVGTIPILGLAWIDQPSLHIQWTLPLVITLLYTGALVTGFSYLSGVVINRELPTIVVSLGFLLVPVVSLLVSAIALHESITLPTIIAMSLIIAGIGCVVVKT
jgi:drug/metabolite transporter (DMT)-like permease